MEAERERYQEFIRWGLAGAEAMFDFPCLFFQEKGVDGFIAYRQEKGTAVVIGDPICSNGSAPVLTAAFLRFCKEQKMPAIFLITTKEFTKATQQLFPISMQVCEELIFDPVATLQHKSRRLRHKVDNALNCGLTAHELTDINDSTLTKAIQQVGQRWHRGHGGRSRIHLGHLDFFQQPQGKRWFYVHENNCSEEVIAMALLRRIEVKEGWLLKYLITVPHAHKNSSELLMTHVLDTLGNEGCCYLSNGMVAATTLAEIRGIGLYFSWLLSHGFDFIKRYFKLDHVKEYWLRYHPLSEPAYILFSSGHLGFKELRALARTLKID